MSPLAEFSEGTQVVLDETQVTLLPGWTEPATGSDVTRIGSLVTLTMQVANEAEPAYVSGTTYAAKEVASEAGALYESIAGGNKGNQPSTDAGVHWRVLSATNDEVCVLPVDYRPLVATKTPDGKFIVKTNGIVESTFALTSASSGFVPLQLSFRAAVQIP